MAIVALAEKGEASTKASILLVEDEILIRLAMADDLRRAGFTVVEASNAEEAMSLLGTTSDIALLVTDIRMPGKLDGIGLANWVRQNNPHIKVAIASANIESGMKSAFDAVFSKPILSKDLVAGVRRLLPHMEQSGPGNR